MTSKPVAVAIFRAALQLSPHPGWDREPCSRCAHHISSQGWEHRHSCLFRSRIDKFFAVCKIHFYIDRSKYTSNTSKILQPRSAVEFRMCWRARSHTLWLMPCFQNSTGPGNLPCDLRRPLAQTMMHLLPKQIEHWTRLQWFLSMANRKYLMSASLQPGGMDQPTHVCWCISVLT